ncbi:hypothetical protein PoB_006279200 [Plakobranchus ocellatus]|uniref:Uncharacterized protein n=1 Tax=Plakobranchus ocellatus TaxID=259542 RepID=A0AAV4CWJ7_9GAST|nr:hypothetical protein PoB_006279200 [Plakobranchus ocellatus]
MTLGGFAECTNDYTGPILEYDEALMKRYNLTKDGYRQRCERKISWSRCEVKLEYFLNLQERLDDTNRLLVRSHRRSGRSRSTIMTGRRDEESSAWATSSPFCLSSRNEGLFDVLSIIGANDYGINVINVNGRSY